MTRLVYLILGIVLGGLAVVANSGIAQSAIQDPVKLSSQYYTVRFENDRVRVFEYRLRPGEKEVMHSHPAYVVYVLSRASLRTTRPDGASSEDSMEQGQVFWREPLSHAGENIGSTEFRAFAVELKPCSR